MTPIDQLLGRLAADTAGRPLDALEPEVWRIIEAWPTGGDIGVLPAGVRVSIVALALAFGTALGGAQAMVAGSGLHEASVFSIKPDLAPSTLLGGRQ